MFNLIYVNDTHEPIEAVERIGDNPKVILTENKKSRT